MDGKVRAVRIKKEGVYFVGTDNKMYLAVKGGLDNKQCVVNELLLNGEKKYIIPIDFDGTKVTAQRIWELLQL